MKGTLQCGTIVVLVTLICLTDIGLWLLDGFVFCVYIPLVICVCLGRFLAFLTVLVGKNDDLYIR